MEITTLTPFLNLTIENQDDVETLKKIAKAWSTTMDLIIKVNDINEIRLLTVYLDNYEKNSKTISQDILNTDIDSQNDIMKLKEISISFRDAAKKVFEERKKPELTHVQRSKFKKKG